MNFGAAIGGRVFLCGSALLHQVGKSGMGAAFGEALHTKVSTIRPETLAWRNCSSASLLFSSG